ncbi:uncharacterized protein EI97DRAFT_432285 [Westerdykella ornata]|uniref:Transcriptional regulatory protein DEP1 n=1 Tax=Westerdykella ornata TaxID=318751 RepID=A0A6A6JMQ4_WESOR|nr:uncharacterized protein EI97DRAFT_432285 [Westerdykella ornata]KAF2277403.1 hypothetical protein EI97DRAFT_432285 [Westerdykella ornata]
MLSSIPSSHPVALPTAVGEPAMTTGAVLEHHGEDGSSSLSELGDASDDHSVPTPRAPPVEDLSEDDSEAETERLDNTPRRLNRTATGASLASELPYERTPSKLAQSTAIDEGESTPASPTVAMEPAGSGSANTALDTLSFLAATEAVSLELAGKKRKRSSGEDGTAEEDTGELSRKRSNTSKEMGFVEDAEATADAEQADVDEELDNAEEHISELAQESMELEEQQAEVAAEAVSELATVAKLGKSRKGRGRGKRKLEALTTEAILAEAEEAPGDADNDEDMSSLDEEAARKKNAIDELAKIEKKFKIFRAKMVEEDIARCELELEMMKQPHCIHPDYLACIRGIDERRAEKIAQERTLMKYKMECLKRQTIAIRHQLHSQYFQQVRKIREDAIADCNHRMYELQKGRRQFGADEVDYGMRMPEKKSERIRQQAAYNLEVSVLAGVGKHVGFPCAPALTPARPSEVERDLRKMEIITRPPPHPIPLVRSYARTATVEEAAAEEQFIEKTPWANPHHPIHQHLAMGSTRTPNQTYQTPVGQRRMVDIHAPNGSASTIDATSNPPSSTAGAGLHNGRAGESISPVLQMKRNPGEQLQYGDNTASAPHPRNFVGITREAYGGNAHVLSSPAGEPMMEESYGQRWAAINSGPPPLPPNAVRGPPLTQRSSLGAVTPALAGR